MKIKTLKKMFNYINQEVFENMLDMPKIILIDPKQSLFAFGLDGYCEQIKKRHFVIGITNHLTMQNTFDTMVHEMIHQYLMEFNGYSGHGKPFKKMCRNAVDTLYWRML